MKKHIITCSNIRCKYNDGYTHCRCKVIGMKITGECATFVPRAKEQKRTVINPMDEHTNMC